MTRRRDRRRVNGRARQVLVLGLGLLAGVLAFLLQSGSWVGHNGDHFYYTATALEYAGVPYNQAITTSTHYFHYTKPIGELDRGSLNPWVAPLMYPRDLLPLLAAPVVRMFGVSGIWVPGVLFGVGSVLGLGWLAWRRVGLAGAAALPLLLLGSLTCTEFLFGVYTEAPLIFLVTVALVLLPLDDKPRGWGHAAAVAALIPLTVLSRQVPVLIAGMVIGGWIWAFVRTRRARNVWWPFVLTAAPTAVVSDLVMARWAPFDPLFVLRAFTHQHTLAGMLRGAAPLFLRATADDARYALAHDHIGVTMFVLAMIGLVLVVRTPLAGVFAGAMGSGLLSAYLSPSHVHFRYEAPVIPVLVLLAVVAVERFAALVRRVPWTAPALTGARAATRVEAEGTGDQAPLRRPAAPQGWVVGATAWCAVVVVVVALVSLHRAAPTRGAPQVQITAAEYGRAWPFTVPSGTLTCAGSDYEVWFQASDGKTYALSGSAMMRSLRTPRALALKAQSEPGWREVIPVLSRGMRLCGRGYLAAN